MVGNSDECSDALAGPTCSKGGYIALNIDNSIGFERNVCEVW